MRWAEHVDRVGQKRKSFKFISSNLKRRGHVRDRGVDGIIILKWIIKKWGVKLQIGLNWLNIGPVASFVNAVMNLQILYKARNLTE